MWQIRPEQMQVLRQTLEQRLREQSIADISSHLREKAPDVVDRYTVEQQRLFIGEVVDVTGELDIVDPDQVLNWSYIRFLINMPFYKMEQFKDILDHPFLHSYSKGRHIVMAFFAIQKMHQEGSR